jgi:hypothetical protein
MMREVIALFDEYQSKENAKYVTGNMIPNAEQNFWNGALSPLGYKIVEVEKRGTKIKKTLAVDPVDAETVGLFSGYISMATDQRRHWRQGTSRGWDDRDR